MVICARPQTALRFGPTIPDETTLHTGHSINECANVRHDRLRARAKDMHSGACSHAHTHGRVPRKHQTCTGRTDGPQRARVALHCAAHGNGASAATAPLRYAVARPIGGNGLSDAVVVGTAGSAWLVGLRASTHGAFKWHVAWDRPWSGHGSAATRAQTGAHVPNKVFADALSVLDAPAEVLRRVGAPAHDPEALWASVCAGERASKGVCAGLDYLC